MTHLELVGYLRAVQDMREFFERAAKGQYDVSYPEVKDELDKMEREAKAT